ncbi:cytochrome b/b6 domain-containing protein [Pseudoalteromonas xiamenensis]
MTKVWDGFIRGFHWLLVTGIVLLYVSGEQEWMDLHFVTGYLLLALFAARLIWGVVGSDTAKIANLFHGPRAVKQALKHEDKRYGHNAAGSYMVLLFFVLIAVQLISGLMSTDDIMMEGLWLRWYQVVGLKSQVTSITLTSICLLQRLPYTFWQLSFIACVAKT